MYNVCVHKRYNDMNNYFIPLEQFGANSLSPKINFHSKSIFILNLSFPETAKIDNKILTEEAMIFIAEFLDYNKVQSSQGLPKAKTSIALTIDDKVCATINVRKK